MKQLIFYLECCLQIYIHLIIFWANLGKGIRIQTPFTIHNADQKSPIFSNLSIGDDCYVGRDCIFDLMGQITIGKKVTISHRFC